MQAEALCVSVDAAPGGCNGTGKRCKHGSHWVSPDLLGFGVGKRRMTDIASHDEHEISKR